MNKPVLIYSIIGFLFAISLSNSTKKANKELITKSLNSYSSITDSIWKVKPIVKLGDPAPGTGGTFWNLGEPSFLESGVLVFSATIVEKKRKYWALYSYKNEKIQPVLIEAIPFSEPDGVIKVIKYITSLPTSPTKLYASPKMYYVSLIVGERKNSNNYVYGWDGDKLIRVLGEGDKVSLSNGQTVIIENALVSSVCNNDQVLISFSSKAPDNLTGFLVHDGVNLRPLFLQGESLPGSGGIKLKDIYGSPFIFNDTVLTIMGVSDAPYKKGLFRITRTKTEKILIRDDPYPMLPDRKVKDFSIFNVPEPNKFLIWTGESLLFYTHGNWKTIVENVKAIPENKGFDKYSIDGSIFIGQKKDSILFSISLIREEGFVPNTYIAGRLPLLLLYNGNSLINIPWYNDLNGVNVLKEFNPKRNSFSPIAIKKIQNSNDLVVKIPWYEADIKSALPEDLSPGTYLLNPSDKELKLRKIQQLRTNGTNSFTLASIIGWIDAGRIFAKTGGFGSLTGFFELSLQ